MRNSISIGTCLGGLNAFGMRGGNSDELEGVPGRWAARMSGINIERGYRNGRVSGV